MKITSTLASLFATSSILAVGFVAAPASAQTYYNGGPADPFGAVVAAPVIAAESIAAAPVAAAADVLAPAVQTNRTAAFVANIMPNINFLDASSRMALDHSSSIAVRRFAHREAMEQTVAGNSVTAWADANPPLLTGRSAYAGDPIVGLAMLPINTVVGVGTVVTGGQIVASSDGRALLRSQADDLARLSSLSGASFDGLYKASQLDALHQLATLYTDYIATGDDPALRALSRSELPKVRMRLLELSRI